MLEHVTCLTSTVSLRQVPLLDQHKCAASLIEFPLPRVVLNFRFVSRTCLLQHGIATGIAGAQTMLEGSQLKTTSSVDENKKSYLGVLQSYPRVLDLSGKIAMEGRVIMVNRAIMTDNTIMAEKYIMTGKAIKEKKIMVSSSAIF